MHSGFLRLVLILSFAISCSPRSISNLFGPDDIANVVFEGGKAIVSCKNGDKETVDPSAIASACAAKPVKAYKKVVSSANDVFCAINVRDELECSQLNSQDYQARVGDTPPYLGKVKDVVMSNDLTCVITIDDELKCWGRGLTGALSSLMSRPAKVKSVAVSAEQICATDMNERLFCFGSRSLADESIQEFPDPAYKISGGEGGICASYRGNPARTDCWGQLGQNTMHFGIDIKLMAGTHRSSCVYSSQSASCLGYNEQSLPSTQTINGNPTSLTVFDFNRWDAERPNSTACATFDDKPAVCWGNNSNGQTNLPSSLGAVKSIAMSQNVACALDLKGSLRCWNYGENNPRAFLAMGAESSRIFAGANTTCAYGAVDPLSGAPVACWGAPIGEGSPLKYAVDATNDNFLIGDGRICTQYGNYTSYCSGGSSTSTDWDSVSVDKDNLKIIRGGKDFTCGVRNTSESEMVCWGNFSPDQNALKTTLSGVRQLATGQNHVCALMNDETVKCFGQNTFGQLNSPDGFKASTLVAAEAYTCGLASGSNELKCWGQVPSAIPLQNTDLRFIALGKKHLCAIDKSEELKCWSEEGSPISEYPRELGVVKNLVSGFNHACVLRASDSKLVCWGDNSFGQSTAIQKLPSNLTSFTDAQKASKFETAVRPWDNILECGQPESSNSGDSYCKLPAQAFYSFAGIKYPSPKLDGMRDLEYQLEMTFRIDCEPARTGAINLKVLSSTGQAFNISTENPSIYISARGPLNLYLRSSSGWITGGTETAFILRDQCSVAYETRPTIKPQQMVSDQTKGLNLMISDAGLFEQRLDDYMGFVGALNTLKSNAGVSQDKLLQDLNANLNKAATNVLAVLNQRQDKLSEVWPLGESPIMTVEGILDDLSELDPYFDDSISTPRRKLKPLRQSKVRTLFESRSALYKLCPDLKDTACIDLLDAQKIALNLALDNALRLHAATSPTVPNIGSDIEKTYQTYKKQLDGIIVAAEGFIELTDFIRESVAAQSHEIIDSLEKIRDSFSNCASDICDARTTN